MVFKDQNTFMYPERIWPSNAHWSSMLLYQYGLMHTKMFEFVKIRLKFSIMIYDLWLTEMAMLRLAEDICWERIVVWETWIVVVC